MKGATIDQILSKSYAGVVFYKFSPLKYMSGYQIEENYICGD
ncbi:hypothetical protein HKBW3S03_00738 [Candidatus Hakubella thermalkaliphila]|uniref:Uncharacterized protein n=1 Tax=Candidatus Hakubella thermalkaliphila TaxID=2754717 RepID=A0A6V8NGA8_9ACTN|nr:hypothetical protein [Candidatus Hakubella thermalkaliphila]GFP19233.1 hypothetical protein HKBW3S03_00738 [Candidatus Hakubella thermalkaliphila]